MTPRARLLLVGAMALVVCSVETGLRLGVNSPDTRFTLPQFSLGYYWDTPLGWTSVIDGVRVNKDSVQFASLAGFFRDEPALPVPLEDNVYVRFAGYALFGSVLAAIVGAYASFVLINVAFWVAAALATYALALRRTGRVLTAVLAALLVSTAPAFEALVGQALPYVASYSLFVLGLLLFEHVKLFDRDLPALTAIACGLAAGVGLLFYDLYMLPAFVVIYGLLRRMPLRNLALVLVAMMAPRIAWTTYWQAAHLASYGQNEAHPLEALRAWFSPDPSRMGDGLRRVWEYVLLGFHGLLNVGSAFLFWPVLLAVSELWMRRRSPDAAWHVAVLVAGFAPALFMLSTWPHIPRWYVYAFPAVYILAAAAAVRIAQRAIGLRRPLQSAVTAAAVVAPTLVLSNLDAFGATKAMELLLFQPTRWSYLWPP